MLPAEIENLRARFSQVMKKHNLSREKVKRERSWICTFSYGEFQCDTEGYRWKSKYSWATFDLINLEIVYRWKMKCKMCLRETEPTFAIPQLEEMFDTVVSHYTGEYETPPLNIGYNGHRHRNFRREPPHLPDLCEKCGYGEEICWKQKFYTMPRP